MKIEIAPEVFDVRKWQCKVVSQPQRRDVHQGAEARAARGRGGAVPRRRLRADRVPAAHARIPRLRHRRRSSATRGTASTSGASSRRDRARSSAPTRWRTIRTRRASCCSRSASRSRPDYREDIPPGIMSSWVFNLKPGDEVTVSGPVRRVLRARDRQGDVLHRRRRRDGADALAHLRPAAAPAHPPQGHVLVRRAQPARGVLRRRVRAAGQRENPNFEWHLALSEPLPEDNWTGPVGFIHNVLRDRYSRRIRRPRTSSTTCAARASMNKAVIDMLLVARRGPREHHARRFRLRRKP